MYGTPPNATSQMLDFSSRDADYHNQPGVLLLSPEAKPRATPTALLSPKPQQVPNINLNLDEEFQTLNIDLDLDLKDEPTSDSRILSPTPIGSHRVLSPSNSRYPFDLNRDHAMSPPPLLSTSNSVFNVQRPSSAQDFTNDLLLSPSSNNQNFQTSIRFYNDLNHFNNWIKNLNTVEQSLFIDNLVGNITNETLLYARTKVESKLSQSMANLNQINNSNNLHVNYRSLSPLNYNVINENEPLTLDSVLNQSQLHQPKPITTHSQNYHNHQHSFLNNYNNNPTNRLSQEMSRPRSADPRLTVNTSINNNGPRSPNMLISPHLNEKTNFLTNRAMELSNGNNYQPKQDLNAQAALKLSALATINSRVQLDSNKKVPQQQDERGRFLLSGNNRNTSNSVPATGNRNHFELPVSPSHNRNLNKPIRKKYNEVSPPPVQANSSSPSQHLLKMASLNSVISQSGGDSPGKSQVLPGTPKSINQQLQAPVAPKSPMPKEIIYEHTLKDIPLWLKTLRLHKYSDCLKDLYWKDMIYLDDKTLEDKGVKALGARRKLLKAFDVVKLASDNQEIVLDVDDLDRTL